MSLLRRGLFLVDPVNAGVEFTDQYLQRQFEKFEAHVAQDGIALPWGSLTGNVADQADLWALIGLGQGTFLIDEGNELGVGWSITYDDEGLDG
jgi:hypothetical protein